MISRVPPFLRIIYVRKSIPYEVATQIQEHLVSQQLAYKASISTSSPLLSRPPDPQILLFESSPVYTFGRRERISSLSKSTIESLIAPMPGIVREKGRASQPHRPLLFETKRGGQTTFHGPGQLVIWPIMDIKNAWPACGPLDVRSYVRLLEECTIASLKYFGYQAIRTRHPGVWENTGENKIAALGVHLRRNISSYGVAINLNTDLRFYKRIVACGLEGKGTTTLRRLIGKTVDSADFAKIWVGNMANLLYGPSPGIISSNSKLPSRLVRGTVRMTGVGPEVLRRLWYLDAPKKVVKFVQTQKKINLEDDSTEVNEASSESADDSPNSSSSFDTTSDSTQIGPGTSEASTRIENLLSILDKKAAKETRASFRKCAGISYWTPPIGRESSASVVRKVGVSSLRCQDAKK